MVFFHFLNKISTNVHSCLFRALASKCEKMIRSCVHLNWGTTVICHNTLKSHKIVFFNFLKKDHIWKLRLCFIPEVLSVGVLLVSSLLLDMYLRMRCVRIWCVMWERHGLRWVSWSKGVKVWLVRICQVTPAGGSCNYTILQPQSIFLHWPQS